MAINEQLILELKQQYDDAGLKAYRKGLSEAKEEQSKFVKGTQEFENAGTKINYFSGKILESNEASKAFTQSAKLSSMASLEMAENITTLAVGIGLAFAEIKKFSKELFDIAESGAELSNMRKHFEELNGGISEASEKFQLLKNASSGTLNDREILEYTNRMDDLNFTTTETAKIMDLAHEKHEQLGISLQEGTNRLTRYIETGNKRGLFTLGMDIGEINKKILEQTGLSEKQIKNQDAETQIIIRKNAVLALYGRSLEEINSKERTNADILKSVSVAFENAKLKIGEFIAGTIGKLAQAFGLTNEKMAVVIVTSGLVVTGILAITAAVVGLGMALHAASGGLLTITALLSALVIGAGVWAGTQINQGLSNFKEEISKSTTEIQGLKTELSDLNTLQDLATNTTVRSKSEQEKYNKTLEDLSKKYPGLTDGVNINKEALENETQAVKNNIARKEELIRLDLEKSIVDSVKAFTDESDSLEKNKKKLADYKEQKEIALRTGWKETADMVVGLDEQIAKLSREIAIAENPTQKLKRNFQELIAEGLKTGNVTAVMEKLGTLTSKNATLQTTLKEAVKGLSSTFIAEYLGINKALAKSAELQGMFATAMQMMKFPLLQGQASALFAKITELAKNIEIDAPVNPVIKTGDTKNKEDKSDPIGDLIDSKKEKLEQDKYEHNLTLEQLHTMEDELMVAKNQAELDKDKNRLWSVILEVQKRYWEKMKIDAKDYAKELEKIDLLNDRIKNTDSGGGSGIEGRKIQKYQQTDPNGGFIKNQLLGLRMLDAATVATSNSVAQLFQAFTSGGDGAKDAFKNFLKSIVNAFLTSVQAMLFGAQSAAAAKGITTFGISLITDLPQIAAAWVGLELAKGVISGLASGGPFNSGMYLVGERGPELALMGSSGYMVNNSQLMNLLGSSGSNSKNIYNTINNGTQKVNKQSVVNIYANPDFLKFGTKANEAYSQHKQSIRVE